MKASVKHEPPKSAFAQACDYVLRHWDALTRFTTDGALALDNNLCESQIRSLAVKGVLESGHLYADFDGVDRLLDSLPEDKRQRRMEGFVFRWAYDDPQAAANWIAGRTLAETEREAVEDALQRLVELGLLKREADGALVLHRLLVAFVQQGEGAGEAQEAVEEALLGEANQLNSEGYPAPLLEWQPHLRAVTDHNLAQLQLLVATGGGIGAKAAK